MGCDERPKTVLPPCYRIGGSGDWWKEQHKYCTGSHHLGPSDVVLCSCECHATRGMVAVQPSFADFIGPREWLAKTWASYQRYGKAGPTAGAKVRTIRAGYGGLGGQTLIVVDSVPGPGHLDTDKYIPLKKTEEDGYSLAPRASWWCDFYVIEDAAGEGG